MQAFQYCFNVVFLVYSFLVFTVQLWFYSQTVIFAQTVQIGAWKLNNAFIDFNSNSEKNQQRYSSLVKLKEQVM